MIHDADAAAASLQLQSEHAIQLLRVNRRRPILHHLRAGPSWLLQLPRPVAATRRGTCGFYNVLIDPKFESRSEGEEEFGDKREPEAQSWVARAMGRGKRVGRIEEVHGLIGEVEMLAGNGKLKEKGAGAAAENMETGIDAVVLSVQGKLSAAESESLLQIDSDVPVFALEEAIASIAALDHFRLVCPIPPFSRRDPDWRAMSLPPLPEWLAVSRLEPHPATTLSTTPLMKNASSRAPALLFAFAVPSPSNQDSSTSTPAGAQSRSQAQARGQNSARALLHNGWAPATQMGPASEGGECIVFIAGSENHAKDQAKMRTSGPPRGLQGRDQQGADEDGDALLSPDAVRAVTYACPSVDVLAVMAPGVVADGQREKLLRGHQRGYARAQKLLRARYWIDVGEDGDSKMRGVAGRCSGASGGDDWVRVSNSGASQGSDGAGARWYTPWRWPGAGVRWLMNGHGSSDVEAKGKKRGLDESDEEDEEDDENQEGNEDENSGREDGAENSVGWPEEEKGGDEDEDESLGPWRDVRRCRLSGGESRVLV